MRLSLLAFLVWAPLLVCQSRQSSPYTLNGVQIVESRQYGFVVRRPGGWSAANLASTPSFYSFRLDQSVQGRVPPRGAAIMMLAAAGMPGAPQNMHDFAEREIAVQHAESVHMEDGMGPPGASSAMQITFEQNLYPGDRPLRFVVVLWAISGRYFGAELSYHAGDVAAKRYQEALRSVVQSFALK